MKSECDYKNMGPFEICDFCVQMRYLINFQCYKFYMKKIPKWLKNVLVPLDSHLEHETTKIELVSYFKNKEVCESLDNPLLDDMKNVKNLGN